MTSSKPIIAISACLMGQNVRYDGNNKYNELIEKTLTPIASITTFCPEVAAGLGTPRPPVMLVTHSMTGQIHALGVEDDSLDVTTALERTAKLYVKLFKNVSGIIFKARSPSCGLNTTPIHTGNNISLGSGLFSSIIKQSLPDIALIDEQGFSDSIQRQQFLTRAGLTNF